MRSERRGCYICKRPSTAVLELLLLYPFLQVPRSWGHATVSIGESVAFAQEFGSAQGTADSPLLEKLSCELYGPDMTENELEQYTTSELQAHSDARRKLSRLEAEKQAETQRLEYGH